MNSSHTPDSKNSNALQEGVDFIFNDDGLMVFTREYHLKRGHCCTSGCLNCPYGYGESVDDSTPVELQMSKQKEEELSADDLLEKYSDFIEED